MSLTGMEGRQHNKGLPAGPRSLLDRLINVGPLLNASQLRRLNEHKYSCQSASILEPYMQHWWNWVVQQLPVWLAPNLITITGLLVNIVTSLMLVYYSPDGKQEVSIWVIC